MSNSPPLSKVASVVSYVRALRAVGAPVEDGLRRAKLPVNCEERLDAWIPYVPMRAFTAQMCEREGLVDLGERASDLAGTGHVHADLAAASLSAPTLFNALEVFARNARSVSTGISVWLESGESTVRVCHAHVVGPQTPGYSIVDAHATRQIVDLVRAFLGPSWLPTRLIRRTERRDRPRAAAPFADAGVRSVEHPSHGGIDIPYQKLWADNPRRSRPSPPTLRYPTGTADALRGCLGAYLPDGRTHVDLAAEMMGLSSARTLQRVLAAERTTYKEVLALATLDAARDYLADGELPLTEIAARLGYSEQSAFTRAFRAWTGAAPSVYRRSMGSADQRAAT